jgi:hypothetical protein
MIKTHSYYLDARYSISIYEVQLATITSPLFTLGDSTRFEPRLIGLSIGISFWAQFFFFLTYDNYLLRIDIVSVLI